MDEKTIKEKMDFFNGKPIELHIVKKDKEWLNCFVISKKSDGIWTIKERKFGLLHIFAGEIYSVEETREEEKESGGLVKR